MSLAITCPSCGSQFKAPDRVAGRSVRCLKCKGSIAVPAAQPAFAAVAPPAPAPLHVVDPVSFDAGPQSAAWLPALLFTGMGVAFFLVIALLVIVLNRQAPGPIADTGNGRPPPAPAKIEPVIPAPIEPAPEVKPPLPDRAERLAAIEAQEKETLAALQKQADKHKQALQKLRKDEDALFPKNKLNAAQTAKLRAKADLFAKDQAAVVRPAIKDAMALARKREEFLQTKRKLLYDHPEAGDDKIDEYNSMLLTPDEIKDLSKRESTTATPRAAALPYVQSDDIKAVLKGTFYAGTFQDPDDADVAAIVYRVGAYREKSDMQVHVFLYRWRGAWSVLELPGRANTVYIGQPPSAFKRTDAGL